MRVKGESEKTSLELDIKKAKIIRKDPNAGKDQWQKEKRSSEDEMARLNQQCKEHELR